LSDATASHIDYCRAGQEAIVVSLITGGSGFIGSHLAEALLARGEQVIILDDLSTGSTENIDHIRGNPALHCFFESVTDRRLLAELMDESDIVYHLAAAVGVRRIIESPVRTIETNVKGTQVVLETAAERKKLVFVASTSEVYGKNNKVPFCEDDDIALGATVRSRWSYAASKALDEFLALAYWKEKKLPVIVARFFNAVGPRQTGRYGMVLPTFVGQALDGVPLTVFGTGKQSRCFAYVGDIVRAILKLVSTDSAVGEVVNIGNDDEITIQELAFLVRERTGSASRVEFTPYDQAYEAGFEDMARRVPSVEKLFRLIGFRPTTPLATVIDQVAEHFTCAASSIG
jgi:UDP-glucose 4-epimerase